MSDDTNSGSAGPRESPPVASPARLPRVRAWAKVWLSEHLMLGLLLLALYWLYGFRPLQVHAGLVVDDFLYVRHARGILDWLQGLSATWLGAFDAFLLSKAPLYGMWLALLNILGIPLRVGEFLLLAAGPFLLARALRPITRLQGWRFGVVVVLMIANPFFPGDYRPHREGLQIALANLCLASTIGVALRWAHPLSERLRWAASAGFLLALCYLNREEAVWMVPALLVALTIVTVREVTAERPEGRSALASLARPGLLLLVGSLAFLQPVLTVCTLNKMHYGVFLTTLRRSPALAKLYERLTSLEPEKHEAYVPINRATRMRAYQLSPTFNRLRPFLEAQDSFWGAGNPAHSIANNRGPADGEIFASTLEFCLYHAAERAGAATAAQMLAMFTTIDRELGEAVGAGSIEAGTNATAIFAAPRPGDGWRILTASWRALWSLLRVAHVPFYWPTTAIASQAELDDLARLTSSSPALYPRTILHFQLRATAVEGMNRAQRVIYPVLLLYWVALLTLRRKTVFTLAPSPSGLLLGCVAIPLAALATFCLGMGVVEVLCLKIIFAGSFIKMGFGPLSIICALVSVALLDSGRGAVPALHR